MYQFEQLAAELGLKVILWRPVKVDNSMIGESSLIREPYISQVFVTSAHPETALTPAEFETKIFILRKQSAQAIPPEDQFYICSLSSKTIVYKGMLTTTQVQCHFPSNPKHSS